MPVQSISQHARLGLCLLAVATVSTVALAESPTTQPSDAAAEKPLLQGPKVKHERSAVDEAMKGGEGFAEQKNKRVGDGRMMEAAMAGIDLSADQKESLREMMGKIQAERRQWNKEHGESFQKLKADIEAARKSGDRKAAVAAREKIKELRDKQLTPHEIAEQVKAILTDEQKAQFDKNTAAIREEMRKQMVEKARDKGAKARENMMGDDKATDSEQRKPRPENKKPKGEKQLDL